MKANRTSLWLLLLLAILAMGAYLLWQSSSARASDDPGTKVLCYQDSMHPWVKSDHAGKCTVCGMDLTPIYEGQTGLGVNPNLVALNSNQITVLNVQTEAVQHRALGRTLRVAGTLDANEARKAVVSAPARGRIDDAAFGYAGVEVEKGQRLITFFSPDLVALRRVLMLGNYASQDTNMAEMKNSPVDRNTAHLVAPLSGVVLERNVYNGQYVGEGDRLLTIADSSALWFRFDVYQRQLPWFDVGQKLEVTVPGLPGRVFPAVVSFVEPALDETSRTVKVRAEVPNPKVERNGNQGRLLKFGMYAEGLVRAEAPDVLSVPRTALLLPGGGAYAYVEKGGGAYERRRVKLGREGDDFCEVLSGLEAGERVVTSGNVLIDAQAQFNQERQTGELGNEEMGAPEPTFSEAPRHEVMSEDHGTEKPAAAIAPALLVCPSSAGTGVVSQARSQALQELLTGACEIAAALAADDVGRFNQHARRMPILVTAASARQGGAGLSNSEPLMDQLAGVGKGGPAKNLAEARIRFLPFSTAAVDLAKQLKKQGPAPAAFTIYHCPMAPKPGLWLQPSGPLANPFYGSKMLRCGEEEEPDPPASASAN